MTNLFMIGRLAKDGNRILVLRPQASVPFPGPWELRAVFAPRSAA
ncbi:hypothetical protein BH23GEM5_BH23GEM5_01550 [soil metagenome]|jgi:hypothetical protein